MVSVQKTEKLYDQDISNKEVCFISLLHIFDRTFPLRLLLEVLGKSHDMKLFIKDNDNLAT